MKHFLNFSEFSILFNRSLYQSHPHCLLLSCFCLLAPGNFKDKKSNNKTEAITIIFHSPSLCALAMTGNISIGIFHNDQPLAFIGSILLLF